MFLGALFSGPLSDSYGRKPLLSICALLQGILALSFYGISNI